MGWKVITSSYAWRKLKKMDPKVRDTFMKALADLEKAPDPYKEIEELTHDLAGFYKFKLGDHRQYRAGIQMVERGEEKIIGVVEVGNRNDDEFYRDFKRLSEPNKYFFEPKPPKPKKDQGRSR